MAFGSKRRLVTLSQGGGVPSWLPLAEDSAKPLLYADYTNNRFWFSSRKYGDEAALNSAWGGTKSGATRQTTVPIVIGGELVSNGDFPSGITGWTAFNSASLSVSGAMLQITGNGGNTPGAAQQVSTVWGRAYAFGIRLDRSGGGVDVQGKVSTNSSLNSAAVTVGGPGANAAADYLAYFGGVQPAQYVGARQNANPANGTSLTDNISVKEVVPVTGWNTTAGTAVSGLIVGVSPASAASEKVLWQSDDASERNRLRLAIKTDGHLYFISTNNNSDVVSIDLGAIATSAAFSVAFSHASGATRASINGNIATSVGGQNPTGCAYMRIGRSFTGETWDGTVGTVSIWAQAQSAEALETLSGPAVVAWGDSLTAGTGASGTSAYYPAAAGLLFTPDRAVANKGVGGETSTQIAARQLAATRALNTRIAWIWVGRNDVANGSIDTSANVAAMVGRVINGKYLVGSILPSTSDGNLSAGASLDRLARNAALSATYGSRYIDILTPLQAAGDGSANDNSDIANGWVPRSLRADAVHLNDAGYSIVAQAFSAATIAAGW